MKRHYQGKITRKQYTSDGVSFNDIFDEKIPRQKTIKPEKVEMKTNLGMELTGTTKVWVPPFEPYEKELVDFNTARGNGINNMRNLNDNLIHMKTAGYELETLNYFLKNYVNTEYVGKEYILTTLASIDINIKKIKYTAAGYILLNFTAYLSLLDGYALVTNPSTDISPYIGFKQSYNDGSKTLVGYGKTAGIVENFSDELIKSWTNYVSFPYNTLTVNANGHDITTAITTGATYGLAWTDVFLQGGLYKVVFNTTTNSGGVPIVFDGTTTGGAGGFFSNQEDGAKTKIFTDIQYYPYLWISSNGLAQNVSGTFSAKQYLTPSKDGMTIVSEKNGNVYSWKSDGGINANSASFTLTFNN
jgi:hypothetical protein